MHAAQRYSLGDWAASVLLFFVGLYLDKSRPFEQYIGNRLADPSISYPHTPPEKQQVTANQLWCIALVLPACGIGVTQLLLRRRRSSDLNQALLGLWSSVALALTLVCFVKNLYGRLRPDFLARCQPVGSGASAACSNLGPEVLEGRKSFPSGHSALSMAGEAYLTLWLGAKLMHAELPATLALGGTLWRLMLAAVPWLFALWVGLSRIEDYWHHWEDVAVGVLLSRTPTVTLTPGPGPRSLPLAPAPTRTRTPDPAQVGVLLGNGCAYAMYRLRYPHPAAGCEPHVASAAGGATGSGLKLKGSNQSSPGDGAESETDLLPADV